MNPAGEIGYEFGMLDGQLMLAGAGYGRGGKRLTAARIYDF